MAIILRMRRDLTAPIPSADWPAGVRLMGFTADRAEGVHALLTAAYAGGFGEVGPFDVWWPALSTDAEFDPALCFVAVDEVDCVVGVAQCWTSAFVKDMAVAADQRGRGVGTALLLSAFAAFIGRGATQVDLKVHADNAVAMRLYGRVGMREAPL